MSRAPLGIRSEADLDALAEKVAALVVAKLSSQPAQDDDLISPNEYKQITGIGTTKLFALLKDGTIKSVKIGASRKIPRSEAVRAVRDGL